MAESRAASLLLLTQPTYSLGSEPPTTHLKNGKGRNTHCQQRLQTIGNTGLLSNSLSIKVFKIFYAFDIAIKHIIFYVKKLYFWLKQAFNYGMLNVDVFLRGLFS